MHVVSVQKIILATRLLEVMNQGDPKNHLPSEPVQKFVLSWWRMPDCAIISWARNFYFRRRAASKVRQISMVTFHAQKAHLMFAALVLGVAWRGMPATCRNAFPSTRSQTLFGNRTYIETPFRERRIPSRTNIQ